VVCPHCQQETLLLISPDTDAAKPLPPEKKSPPAGLILVGIVVVGLFLLLLLAGKASRQNHTGQPAAADLKLKPVIGAFGYNLGDKFSGESSISLTNMPPFDSCTINTLADGRICAIFASGFVDNVWECDDAEKRLVSVLTEKYGLRSKTSEDPDRQYFFGTLGQSAFLVIRKNRFFNLLYYDAELQSAHVSEQSVKQEKADEILKAALKKGL